MSTQYADPVEMEARVVKLEQLLATLMQNGLQEMLGGRALRWGEMGAMRTGPEGLLFVNIDLNRAGINSITDGAPGSGIYPGLYWLYDWPTRVNPPPGDPQSRIIGFGDSLGQNTYLEHVSELVANTYYGNLITQAVTEPGVAKRGTATLAAITPANAFIGLYVEASQTDPGGVAATRLVYVDGPFRFANVTADPTIGPSDGMLVYRSDTDVLRLRANGAWVNLLDTTHEAAADPHTGYVREADANWVDLTDSGATTLHSHAGGGMKKVSGTGYVPLPAGPGPGVTVTKSATADTYGSYAELRAAAGSGAIYIFGVLAENMSAAGNTYLQIAIATGAAGAEVDVAVVKTHNPPSATGDFIPLATPVAVAATTRIAARFAGSRAVADSTPISLLTCAQSDLVDL